MKYTGGCYCGQVRYEIDGEPLMKAQCHCRECQYITGGSPNVFMALPISGLKFTAGEVKSFTRSDLDDPVSRDFCANCGTHLFTRSPRMAEAVIVKVGSLDEPALFGQPQMAIFTCDKQEFHRVPEGVAEFERVPG